MGDEDAIRQVATGGLADRLTQTRYIASIYSLDRSGTSVVCIMLYQGSLGDDSLRGFIKHHITRDVVPQLTLGDGECMFTMNLVILSEAPPFLCDQLRDFCGGRSAIRFLDPLHDADDHQVTLLSLDSGQWDEVRDVASQLRDAIRRDAMLADVQGQHHEEEPCLQMP